MAGLVRRQLAQQAVRGLADALRGVLGGGERGQEHLEWAGGRRAPVAPRQAGWRAIIAGYIPRAVALPTLQRCAPWIQHTPSAGARAAEPPTLLKLASHASCPIPPAQAASSASTSSPGRVWRRATSRERWCDCAAGSDGSCGEVAAAVVSGFRAV